MQLAKCVRALHCAAVLPCVASVPASADRLRSDSALEDFAGDWIPSSASAGAVVSNQGREFGNRVVASGALGLQQAQ
jgi:hypothetical protein